MGRHSKELSKEDIANIKKTRIDISKRLEILCEKMKMNNPSQLFNAIGMRDRHDKDIYWRAKTGAREYPDHFFEALEKVFPDVNIIWLKTGKGSMLRERKDVIVEDNYVSDRKSEYQRGSSSSFTIKTGLGHYLMPGDIVQAKKQNEDDIIHFGKAHIIVTTKGDELVKYLLSDGDNYILRSHDVTLIPDIRLSKKDVKELKRITHIERFIE